MVEEAHERRRHRDGGAGFGHVLTALPDQDVREGLVVEAQQRAAARIDEPGDFRHRRVHARIGAERVLGEHRSEGATERGPTAVQRGYRQVGGELLDARNRLL